MGENKKITAAFIKESPVDPDATEINEASSDQPAEPTSGGVIKMRSGEKYPEYLERIAKRHPHIEPEKNEGPLF